MDATTPSTTAFERANELRRGPRTAFHAAIDIAKRILSEEYPVGTPFTKGAFFVRIIKSDVDTLGRMSETTFRLVCQALVELGELEVVSTKSLQRPGPKPAPEMVQEVEPAMRSLADLTAAMDRVERKLNALCANLGITAE